MKRRTNPELEISIPDLDVADIESIDFIFKATHSETAPAIAKKSYPDEVTYNAARGTFLIPFTEKETLLFTGKLYYMDTRPITKYGKIIPTEIATDDIKSTLFGDADV